MNEFLNEKLKPYNALTREEKHTVAVGFIDKNLEIYGLTGEWVQLNNYYLSEDMIYRTKPKEYKKLDIPWDVIDEKWKYAAMDDDGEVYIYDTLPNWRVSYWSDTSSNCMMSVFKLDTTGIIAEHSLTKRPEGV